MKNKITLALLSLMTLSPAFADHVEDTDYVKMITPGATVTITRDMNIKPDVEDTYLGESTSGGTPIKCYLRTDRDSSNDRIIKAGKTLTTNTVVYDTSRNAASFFVPFTHSVIRGIYCNTVKSYTYATLATVYEFKVAISGSATLKLTAPVVIE